MHKAMLWERLGEDKVRCFLCSHHCKIRKGERGVCGVRENADGELVTLIYDKVIARNVDPIEKKPLFHFLPGSFSFSIATPGCNFRCLHCQNADISQMPRDSKVIMGEPTSPEAIVETALRANCKSISYTYTEPTIFFELAYDTARLAVKEGLKNVFVTNGYITSEALDTIKPYLHAANIDLKSFRDDFYRKVCGARLEKVLDAIRHYHECGIWVEVTTLIIPGYNDDPSELRDIARFLVSIDKNIPWHVTQFHPTYKLFSQPRTPVEKLREARDIGFEEGLRYVYEGNVPGEGGEDTRCAGCGSLLIKRYGYIITEAGHRQGVCPTCGERLPGVFD
jgi:pyruvate formate lyase activating enzyme